MPRSTTCQSAPFRLGQAERQDESWRVRFFAPLATEERPGMCYLILFLGAGIGGALRHGTNLACARLCGTAFPWGTLTVNVVGSSTPGPTFSADRVIGVLAAGWLLRSRCWNVVRVERPQHQKGAAMNHYAGLDVSLEETSIRVVDGAGLMVKEVRATSGRAGRCPEGDRVAAGAQSAGGLLADGLAPRRATG